MKETKEKNNKINNKNLKEKCEIINSYLMLFFVSHSSKTYIYKIDYLIKNLIKDLNECKSNASDAIVGGFAAESWHAGTFNINAAAANIKNIAYNGKPGINNELGRNNYASIDISIKTPNGKVINDYSCKYMSNAINSVRAQSELSKKINNQPKYHNQKRLIPSDQIENAKEILEKKIKKEKNIWKSLSYKETNENLTDVISDGKITSNKLSKKEDLILAKKIKNNQIKDNNSLEEFNISINKIIKIKYFFKKIFLIALISSLIIMIFQIVLEIIDYIFITKKNNDNSFYIRKILKKILLLGIDSFLKGIIISALQIYYLKNYFYNFGFKINFLIIILIGILISLIIDIVKYIIINKNKIFNFKKFFTEKIIISFFFLIINYIGLLISNIQNIISLIIFLFYLFYLLYIYLFYKKTN